MISESIFFEDMDYDMKQTLATLWDLRVEDIDALQPEIHPDINHEGFPVSYTATFKADADKSILARIEDLQDGNSVSVGLWDINDDSEHGPGWVSEPPAGTEQFFNKRKKDEDK